MRTQVSTDTIHTEPRCRLNMDENGGMSELLKEMKLIEEQEGPVLWRLCNGLDHITPTNHDRMFFYFEAVLAAKPSAYAP